ncbi:MAG: aldose 1-epimerase family protein [Lachnospiraceae bacterium]|nr:aldose 1-epimerase family protein [Lachnospiraceae bacterium]
MAVYSLKNSEVSIEIHSKGAELKSLKKLSTGAEYMWKADSAFWGRTAPVLFPFVGSVNRKQYRTGGRTYTMNQHGFARDMEFVLLSQSGDEIWFAVRDNEETRENYPFQFVLKTGYRLLSDGVEVLWEVENPGEEELPFSIGAHPAFNCPLAEGTEKSDCFIYFGADGGAPADIASTRIHDGLVIAEKGTYDLEDGCLAVTEHLFDCDTLLLEDYQVNQVSLCGKDKKPYVTVTMDAPVYGIWTPSHPAPFICIEPWFGRCDAEGFTGDLKEREWGNTAPPKESWKASYKITI